MSRALSIVRWFRVARPRKGAAGYGDRPGAGMARWRWGSGNRQWKHWAVKSRGNRLRQAGAWEMKIGRSVHSWRAGGGGVMRQRYRAVEERGSVAGGRRVEDGGWE